MNIIKNGAKPGPSHLKLLPSGKEQMNNFFQSATKLMELHLRELVKKSLNQIVEYFQNYISPKEHGILCIIIYRTRRVEINVDLNESFIGRPFRPRRVDNDFNMSRPVHVLHKWTI